MAACVTALAVVSVLWKCSMTNTAGGVKCHVKAVCVTGSPFPSKSVPSRGFDCFYVTLPSFQDYSQLVSASLYQDTHFCSILSVLGFCEALLHLLPLRKKLVFSLKILAFSPPASFQRIVSITIISFFLSSF